MNYYNWQKIHKAAHASKAQPKNPALSIEIIHMRAWAELNRICFREELIKLLKLAEQYDNGERLPDTAYLSQEV